MKIAEEKKKKLLLCVAMGCIVSVVLFFLFQSVPEKTKVHNLAMVENQLYYAASDGIYRYDKAMMESVKITDQEEIEHYRTELEQVKRGYDGLYQPITGDYEELVVEQDGYYYINLTGRQPGLHYHSFENGKDILIVRYQHDSYTSDSQLFVGVILLLVVPLFSMIAAFLLCYFHGDILIWGVNLIVPFVGVVSCFDISVIKHQEGLMWFGGFLGAEYLLVIASTAIGRWLYNRWKQKGK